MSRAESTLARRAFLRRAGALAAAAACPAFVPSEVLGRGGAVAPSERIAVGAIGVGGRGQGVMAGFLASSDARVVAVCDVKRPEREMARDAVDRHYGGKGCAAHGDFRELVERPDIDLVSIASNDHWHVLHALAAVRAGKDVYVEKPLGLSVEELKALRAAVHRHGRSFQFGTQQRSEANFRHACELVLNGRIGRLRAIRVSAPSGAAERTGSATYEPAPVPDGFDYDSWLGPAPWAPYTPKRVVNPHWFHISDYSLGYVAGWGIHHVDIAQWGNGTELTGPVEVEGSGVFPEDDGLCDNALSWDVDLKYSNGVAMSFTSDGGKNPHGIRFEGDDGWVYVRRGFTDAHPKALLGSVIGPDEVRLPASRGHQQDLLDSARTRRPTVCPIDVAVRSDTVCHLSDIAMRLGRKLHWDPEAEAFVGDPDANRMLSRAMRGPWSL
ncbi:MAG: Gfo/Idh/MocA family oxidoreductase [Planctomycetes bacterium]|nr:Gfo/Idh/MocA family oxidoreductase [Planctomycetota bacterium]